MKARQNALQVVPPGSPEVPVELTRITPRGSIRLVFWGLRIYIVTMIVLVIIGFSRGMH